VIHDGGSGMSEQHTPWHIPWDDLRTVLAIAQAGSLSGAARALNVSHATVFRRLGAIEERLGVRLFERNRAGYTPTPAGEDVAEAARRIESEVAGVERRVAGRDLLPSGTLRVTTTDTLLDGLLSPIFAAFCHLYPEINLEVAVSNTLFSLSKREADVAIRPTSSPPENLVGRRVARIQQAVYKAAQESTDGVHELDLDSLDWVGPDERMAYLQLDHWMCSQGHDARCRYRVDTLNGMRAAVRDGIGVAALPCYLGDPDERLARLSEPVEDLSVDLWLLTHSDLRNVARIRAFMDSVAEGVRDRIDPA